MLKALLRKERFDTPSAMRLLELHEPAINDALMALEHDGWISFDGTEGGIDCWRPADKGMRLTATRLLKRIPYQEGRNVLARLIEEARAINTNPGRRRGGSTCRIGRPRLVRVLEGVDAAAAAWCQEVQAKLRGLGAEISVDCDPEVVHAESARGLPIDVRPLVQPLRDALDRAWKKRSGQQYEGWKKRVAVTLAAKPILTFEQGWGVNTQQRVIRGEHAAPATETARELYCRFQRVLEGEHWVVYCRGDSLVSEQN